MAEDSPPEWQPPGRPTDPTLSGLLLIDTMEFAGELDRWEAAEYREEILRLEDNLEVGRLLGEIALELEERGALSRDKEGNLKYPRELMKYLRPEND